MTHHARQEDDERVDHALDQGERHHVAVGDVAHFVRQHRLGLVAAHGGEQPAAHRHQCLVAAHAGGKGVHLGRVVHRHLRHADAGSARLAPYRFQQPALGLVRRLLDDPCAGKAFGGPLGQRQRQEGAAHAEHGGEHQQRREVKPHPLLVENALDAEQPQGDAQDRDNGQIGGQKQDNAFHDAPLVRPVNESPGTPDKMKASRALPSSPPFSQREKGLNPLSLRERGWGEGWASGRIGSSC